MYIPFKEKNLFDGLQKLYKFSNNQGASVIQHSYSYGGKKGLWELAHLEFDEEGYHWYIVYDIFGGVIGHLTEEEIEVYLKQIENL